MVLKEPAPRIFSQVPTLFMRFILLLGQLISQPHNLRGKLFPAFFGHMAVNGVGGDDHGNASHADNDTGNEQPARPDHGAAHANAQEQYAHNSRRNGGDGAGAGSALIQSAQLIHLVFPFGNVFFPDLPDLLLLFRRVAVLECIFLFAHSESPPVLRI